FLMTDSLPAFYENNHNGFTRVVFPGIDIQDEVKSVIFTDFDHDNLYDLSFTSFMGGCRLYHNTGDFVFEDITASAGIPNGTGLMTFCQAWGDYDLDGDLDFFICNYNSDSGNPGYDALYRNNGNLTFTNVTESAGIFSDLDPTFCAVWSDYNNDGLPDLYVLNDRASWRNFLYRNNGNGTFTEVGVSAGMSDFMDSMSATMGDYNNDGREDIYISNTPLDGNKLFRNNASFHFSDAAASLGAQIFGWSWGASWIDYNNDGKQDLFVSTQAFSPMAQPGGLYLLKNNLSSFDLVYNAGFQTVSGSTFSVARGDLNNDGFYDLITNSYAPMNA
ncbi:MAG: VCBS repeat-containing protein, partial [Bacteroidia bacterium]